MKTRYSLTLSVVLMTLIALLTNVLPATIGKDTKQRVNSAADQTQKRLYERASYQGAVYGTISFSGVAPKRREIDMSADSVCAQINRRPLTQDVVVKNGKLANVFIYVKSGSALDEFDFKAPEQAEALEHKKCQYAPRALGLQAGQTLNVINSDPTAHNTNVQALVNLSWNISQPPGAEPIVKQFTLAETFIPFKCNQHPWEKAYIGVFAHPFFITSDESGSYRIEGLPPGRYTLIAWHEKFGEKEIVVTIAGGEGKRQDFTFDARRTDGNL